MRLLRKREIYSVFNMSRFEEIFYSPFHHRFDNASMFTLQCYGFNKVSALLQII
ncbi:hypothetical protein B4U79_06790 [Dinothrombium tinctorium]|uniref:Uncharacterized protein n=1 Tax=Dinothrombium tinctorium TaxID=1965070 RepID=A0A443RNZ1_9ACAR|nr:hypothetical protein B4U79_06790 [Dinothrombium tinctorium]